MHEQCIANMHKCQCMKFSCIISGCPAGARKWHISYFAMHYDKAALSPLSHLIHSFISGCLRIFSKTLG